MTEQLLRKLADTATPMVTPQLDDSFRPAALANRAFRALVEESAQSYEQPEEVVRWHYQDRTRLADFDAQALEQNVIAWVLARCQVAELQTTFAELTGVAG